MQNSFLYELTPTTKGDKNDDIVASPESVLIPPYGPLSVVGNYGKIADESLNFSFHQHTEMQAPYLFGCKMTAFLFQNFP